MELFCLLPIGEFVSRASRIRFAAPLMVLAPLNQIAREPPCVSIAIFREQTKKFQKNNNLQENAYAPLRVIDRFRFSALIASPSSSFS